jgi:nucleotide-binding universal stress UspA family protein
MTALRVHEKARPVSTQRQRLARVGGLILRSLAIALLTAVIGVAIALLAHAPAVIGQKFVPGYHAPAAKANLAAPPSVEYVAAKVLSSIVTPQTNMEYPDVRVHTRLVCDVPDRWLLDESKNAQLVVLGSGGRGGYAGMHLGSVTSAVVRSARVPVVVVRHGYHEAADHEWIRRVWGWA